MSRVNTRQSPIYTHEGGKAKRINAEQQLRRSVMACLLWERQFYESGVSIATRICDLVPKVEPDKVAGMAVEAREQMNLRHVPLLLVREMARSRAHKHLVANTLARVIQRPDELTEFLAIYWLDGRQPLSAQVKKGLARAFTKFDAYQLAKYNRADTIKLKDVLFLSHAKPNDKEQESLWQMLIADSLPIPDTWEVRLSAGADKKAAFEALQSLQYAPKLKGRTVILVDVSGSMEPPLSQKSDMSRMDAACGVAMIGRELCEDSRVFTFSNLNVEIPARRGFALRDAVVNSQDHQGTYLGKSITVINQHADYDRIIVVTDEQAHDTVPDPKGKGYMINVASYQNGVGYGAWTHIDGWSEAVIKYITEVENND